MGCNNHGDNGFNCVCEVVRFIDSLQPSLVSPIAEESCTTGCLRDQLGPVAAVEDENNCNTRPFALIGKDGNPFSVKFRAEGPNNVDVESSEIFRVEGFFGDDDDSCCAVLRVLFRPEETWNTTVKDALKHPCDLVASDTCIVVDLTCFCAIQCFDDVFLTLPEPTAFDCCD